MNYLPGREKLQQVQSTVKPAHWEDSWLPSNSVFEMRVSLNNNKEKKKLKDRITALLDDKTNLIKWLLNVPSTTNMAYFKVEVDC